MRKLQFADLLEISDQAPPAARDILQSISTALVDGPLLLKNLRSKDLTKRADFKSAKSWLTRQINDQAQAIVESGSLNFKTLRRWAAARHLVEQLSLEVQIGRPKSHSVTFPDCEHPNTKHLIGIYSRHPTAGSVPTMLLDASGDAHLYSQIFSDMKIHNLEARRNANIYQVQRKSFSRQSILGVDAFGREIRPDEAEKLRQDIIQVIVGRLEVHEKILVVAQLAVTKFLEGPLQPYIDLGRIQLAHFNALRGLNSFESCTSAVIVGRVQPSPGAVEALARALYWDDPKPLVLGLNQYTRKHLRAAWQTAQLKQNGLISTRIPA